MKVVNSDGIRLRRHPVDKNLSFLFMPIFYARGKIIRCSHMVQASSGIRFYRVEGTDGWVFDKRDGRAMLTLISEEESNLGHLDMFDGFNGHSWTPAFVRGIASTIPGISEISVNKKSRLISFESNTSADVRINVYYTTRTIGTALKHPTQGKTQLFRRNCTREELALILQYPRVHTGKGYKQGYKQRPSESDVYFTVFGPGYKADEEADYRNALLELDREMAAMNTKRRDILNRIRDADLRRAEEAKEMKSKIDARQNEIDALEEAKRKKVQKSRRS